MSEYVIRVGENCTARETWETASNYTKHRLTPGVYPIEFVDIDHKPVREGERPYYAIATIPTTIVEIYYVNRILNHTSAHQENPNKPGTILFRCYAYEIDEGIKAYNDATIEKV